jgi:hypothetical protein
MGLMATKRQSTTDAKRVLGGLMLGLRPIEFHDTIREAARIPRAGT